MSDDASVGMAEISPASTGRARVRLWHYGLPLAILVACVGLLALALVQLTDIARSMRLDAPGNMLWVIGQAEVETLRTLNTVTSVRLDGFGETARDDLALRYDLLASRLDLLNEGPQRRMLDTLDIGETIAGLTAMVRHFDPRMHPLNDDSARAFESVLSELQTTLNRAANRQMVADWEKQSGQYQRYRETVSQVIASVLGVILGAVLLGWQIISGKQALLRAEEARLRAISLEHELKGVRAMACYYRDFASVVSHQFRTELAIIDSAMQRLVRGGTPPDMAALEERRAIIRQTVSRLTRLVDAALMAGRLDHGAIELHIGEHDLVALARDLRDEFQRGMPDRDLRFDAPNQPLPVTCDPALVSHIVMNLIDNAFKYSPPCQPVSVRFETSGERRGCTVSDCGSGISDSDLPHIFDKFRRGRDRTDMQGSGIGLWIACQLAELQGGGLTVANSPGRGAAFTLWLPAASRPDLGQERTKGALA